MVNVHLEDDERIVRPLRKQRGCLMKNFRKVLEKKKEIKVLMDLGLEM